MKTITRALTAVWPIIVALGCGGGQSSAETRDEAQSRWESTVREVVEDPVRANRVLAAAEDIRVVGVEFETEARAFLDDYRRLNRDYDATREQFEALIADHKAERASQRRRIYEARQTIVDNTTDEEWGELVEAKNAAVRAAVIAALDAVGQEPPSEETSR